MLVADGHDIGGINEEFAMNQAQPNAREALETAKEMLRNFRERIMLPEDMAIEVNNSRSRSH